MSGRLWATLKEQAGSENVPYPEHNPLTKTGEAVMSNMQKRYGSKKGMEVFYSSINAGKPGSEKWHVKRGKK